jgi:hypothetical protein
VFGDDIPRIAMELLIAGAFALLIEAATFWCLDRLEA